MEANVKIRCFCAKVLVAALLATTSVSFAQETKKAEEKTPAEDSRNWPVKIFQVKYANVNQLARVFNAFGAIINADPGLNVISVRAPKEVLAAIEESIQRLDVPPAASRNIDLTAYLLIGSMREAPTDNPPSELDPVVKQLKAVFNYKGFRLLDTLVMRVREQTGGNVHGSVASPVNDVRQPIPYDFHINSVSISSEGAARVVRINNLNFTLHVPHPSGHFEVGVQTDIDVREGQKAVVGKANIDNADNALILVLTAKVIE
jgi:Bacterial type II/III secretion system short domain